MGVQQELEAIVGADGLLSSGCEEYAVDGVTPKWVAIPSTPEQVRDLVVAAGANDLKVTPLGGGVDAGIGAAPERVDLVISTTRLTEVTYDNRKDMTIGVGAGMTLSALSDHVKDSNLWLPVDLADPGRATLGGMVAVEIAKIASPVAVVVISSAKTRSELPPRYRILKWLPLHRIFGGRFYKATGQVARPIFEPDSREDDEVFAEMLRDKDPRFMRRSIDCIVTWENGTVPPGVVHIHGDRDHTIPARNVRDAIIVEGGSHVMVFTRGAEISALVNRCLAR